MSDFMKFKDAVKIQMDSMISLGNIFRVNVDKEFLYNQYLTSFKPKDNPIYKERTEHDCNCCKNFIRDCGNMVRLTDDLELVTIWDVKVDGFYQDVADKMAEYVKGYVIKNTYLHYQNHLGTDFNHQDLGEGGIKRWDHFHYVLPNKFVKRENIDSFLGDRRTNFEVFKRALEEINLYSVDTVLELIEQNSLPRGEEQKDKIGFFLKHKTIYDSLKTDLRKERYAWLHSKDPKCRIRNTSIGTLLVNLSDGMELNKAVGKYDAKMAPENYKRPTALVTQAQVDKAFKESKELGIESSFERRHANKVDISINNVIYADRSFKESKGIFDNLSTSAPKVQNYDNVEEITIERFIEHVIPKAEMIEVLVENNHENNLMTLTVPVHPESKNIFQWDNNASWSYKGSYADSVEQRIKAAGGDIDAFMCFRLSWFNTDDLDAHAYDPNNIHTYHAKKKPFGSNVQLDVDMNVSNLRTDAVENIVVKNKSDMINGKYVFSVKNYTKRNSIDVGFNIDFVIDGQKHSYNYPKTVKDKGYIPCIELNWTNGSYEIKSFLDKINRSKEIWNIKTNKFQKVSMIMNSPNYWDSNNTGNKHWFFMLDDCKNPNPVRGFYNENLRNSLNKHRKVFEILGDKMKTPYNDDQLSGLGFSSTKRNSLVCKVTGSFTRMLKVVF